MIKIEDSLKNDVIEAIVSSFFIRYNGRDCFGGIRSYNICPQLETYNYNICSGKCPKDYFDKEDCYLESIVRIVKNEIGNES